MEGIRVVLGDDHAIVRTGIKALMSSAGFHVVAEAGDGRELLRQVRHERPDIAVVDISMPLLDGLEATQRIAAVSPNTRVVILSMLDDIEYQGVARTAGAWGFVSKDMAAEELIDVVQRVAAGEHCLPEAHLPDVEDPLTAREREVLQLIAEGKKNAEIATIMNRSINTVRTHRARLMHKLGAKTGPQIVRLAEERGLLRVPPQQTGA